MIFCVCVFWGLSVLVGVFRSTLYFPLKTQILCFLCETSVHFCAKPYVAGRNAIRAFVATFQAGNALFRQSFTILIKLLVAQPGLRLYFCRPFGKSSEGKITQALGLPGIDGKV